MIRLENPAAHSLQIGSILDEKRAGNTESFQPSIVASIIDTALCQT